MNQIYQLEISLPKLTVLVTFRQPELFKLSNMLADLATFCQQDYANIMLANLAILTK